jgi:hypothetical protein
MLLKYLLKYATQRHERLCNTCYHPKLYSHQILSIVVRHVWSLLEHKKMIHVMVDHGTVVL